MKFLISAFAVSTISIISLTGCFETTNNNYGYHPTPLTTPSYTGYTESGQEQKQEPIAAFGVNKYDPNSLANPYGAGSPYKPDGLMNPYSEYGSKYSNKSWRNPYATEAPKLYDSNGNYRGKLSANKYDPDSISNPYGKYGNKYSPSSIKNPYGAGNPYNSNPVYVVPQKDSGFGSGNNGFSSPSLPSLPTLPTFPKY